MTPTLSGRIQTRLALLALIGVPWTTVFALCVPGGLRYGPALASLLVIAALGIGWELLYHGFQQLRWDRDWPSLFALVAGVPEGALAWPVLDVLGLAPPSWLGFIGYFGSTWLLIWLMTQGPVRVFAPRWRHTGGRLLSHRFRACAPAPRASDAAKPSGRARLAWAAVGVVTLLTLSGSAGLAPLPDDGPRRQQVTGGSGHTADRVEPVSLAVPRIEASSTLVRLGRDAAGGVETPPASTPTQAGWYVPGPAPGQNGPAVIVGHVDGTPLPGIFVRLRELVPGDEILIGRADSSVLRFVVTRTEPAPTGVVPPADAYGPAPGRELRLITCTATPRSDNVIVFATLAAGQEPSG